jgi:hypothetical protein
VHDGQTDLKSSGALAVLLIQIPMEIRVYGCKLLSSVLCITPKESEDSIWSIAG